ncbi:hypothetical protein [Oscillatoria sp. FACHB-1406]|uniref:hypothetical protein n=1 Tax=Oscillatoria sp. FACHB-1406 TaxID=2692846 RepID=UPI001684F530|nr:hypothetical protein [Oscillatoria sp. FACHB-1406]MBD2576625.1 hypothetical protein [Oscillatoria sp. FACHB-1406]
MSGLNRSLLDFLGLLSIPFGRRGRNRALSGCAAIALAGGGWFAATSLIPPAAIAYSSRTAIALNRQGQESYETFLRRAEAIARAATQRRFDSDILVTDVSVTIVGQNNGAAMPVLILNVSRNDWRKQPDPQRWAKYFRNASVLLGFEPRSTTSPGTTPPPPPPEPTPVESPSPVQATPAPSPRGGVPLPPNTPGNPPPPTPVAPAVNAPNSLPSPVSTPTPTPTPR